MDAVRASAYLVSPWREQKKDWLMLQAAWGTVAAENEWIEMREYARDGSYCAYCTLCDKWLQDDHAASQRCLLAVRAAGYEPGPILSPK